DTHAVDDTAHDRNAAPPGGIPCQPGTTLRTRHRPVKATTEVGAVYVHELPETVRRAIGREGEPVRQIGRGLKHVVGGALTGEPELKHSVGADSQRLEAQRRVEQQYGRRARDRAGEVVDQNGV